MDQMTPHNGAPRILHPDTRVAWKTRGGSESWPSGARAGNLRWEYPENSIDPLDIVGYCVLDSHPDCVSAASSPEEMLAVCAEFNLNAETLRAVSMAHPADWPEIAGMLGALEAAGIETVTQLFERLNGKAYVVTVDREMVYETRAPSSSDAFDTAARDYPDAGRIEVARK